jgi:proline dehydrogenase
MYLKLLSGIRHNPGSNPDEGASPVLTGGPGAVQPILPASEPINISIKLTQCGLDLGQEVCEANLREVLAVAKANQTFVRVDMEASEYTERTLDVIYKVFDQFPCVGTVLQSYLYRTDDDVEALIQRGIRCRLVKGAYLEPAEVAYPEKSKVDEAYVRQAKRLLDDGFYPAIATQDEEIIRELNRYVEEKKIDRSRFEYQMLYGIRRDLQAELFKSGYNVRIYIPFGDSWYPYFTRRLAERPANLAFIARSFLKG